MTGRTALVTGISGQDGQLAARMLLAKGYRVVGTGRRGGAGEDGSKVVVEPWDLRDAGAFAAILGRHRPAEIYNFAAFSSGAGMYDRPVDIGDINGLAVARMLEAIREISPEARFCQASSSELFGQPETSPQDERTSFHPRSPYGAAKLYAHTMVNIYRERYGLFACSAILFNHESPSRGPGFVTRKVTQAAARAKLGRLRSLSMGNLAARRDWGYAGDTVEAMWRMLQAEAPGDYVVATGRTHSVRDLCAAAFGHVGLDYRDYVVEDAAAFRDAESVQLVGDATRAAERLGWRPSIDFETLIRMMVDADLAIERARPDDPGPEGAAG